MPRLGSLKARITVTALVILLAGIWSLSFFANQMLRRDIERMLGDQQYSIVTLIATQIEQEMAGRILALNRTNSLVAEAMGHGNAALQTFVDSRVNLMAMFNGGIVVTDAKGEVIADSAPPRRRADALGIDAETLGNLLRNGQATVSRPTQGRNAQSARFAIATPVFGRDNKVIGALIGITDIDGQNFLDSISHNRYGRTGHYLLVDGRHRLIITSTGQRRVLERLPPLGTRPMIDAFVAGREGSQIHRNVQGVEVLSSVKRIASAGWLVVADLPTDEAFEPIRDMQWRVWIVSLLLSLVTVSLIGWILRRQLSPLDHATRLLAALPDDSLPRQALPVAQNDEIGQLIRRFNRVLQTLWQREAALRESEERFKVLYDASFGGIMIHDNGIIIDCNQGLCELSGYSRDELIGSDGFLLVTPECRDAIRQHAQSGYEQAIEGIGLRKDGSRYDISAAGKNIHYKGRTLRVTELRDIGARKQAEDSLRQSEESFGNFFHKNSSVMLLTEPFTGEIVNVNESACRYYGYTREQMIGMNISVINTMAPAQISEQRLRALNNECNVFYFVHRLASGELRDVETHLSPIDQHHRPLLFSIIHDITERKRAEEKLELAASVFSHAREAIMITRADGTIIDVNDAFTRITGYARGEVIGRNPRMLDSGRQGREFFAELWQALREKGHWYGEIWNRHKSGDLYASLQTISTVFDARRVPQHYVALFSDITAFKEHEKKLEHVAHYDVLTTLPNRVLLADRMKQAMAHALRRGQLLGVAYLDLDGFKAVNDQHGHETGDRLLIALAERMKQSLREGDTLARLGGDEFIAVLGDLGSPSASLPLLSRMLEAAATPVLVGDLELRVSASLGATYFPQADDVDADQLLRQADQAMYQAKLAGKNRFHLFDAEQDRNVRGHHESLEHIRRALEARELVLHYQPKVNMRTGAIIGTEALIRWAHPERGLLPPGIFLPVVEEHPLAVDIGEWVIEHALQQTEDWQHQGINLPVSVNVGGRQLLHGDFTQRLRDALGRHPAVAPQQLEIEVLETSALEDLVRVSQIINDCQALGVSFALDDFGTGYSSLTYLKRLSVNQLKIDQSFVRDMLDDPDDLSILGGVLNMATAFRRQVIAEGVETVAHGTMLLQLGCELAQGYGIARPMPAEAIPGWIASWQPNEAWTSMQAASRDDLPLLFAGVEHRAWVTAVEDFLNGRRSGLPLSHHQCRFSAWLDEEGRAMHEDRPAFISVIELHRDIHQLASRLCSAEPPLAADIRVAGIEELRQLRDNLLAQLQALITDTRSDADRN
ncbi:PAS domain S-box-containing protein/diguanylate cyclase (GGDEF) domain-containing protein [Propionivibrio dicarboxylicus]|uniref:PAS domain S-box-containing protein/diguanylate cyclase (GGDEF) domain-containing protein n=2 Tax=Propionivibrio dicarboxylicus TaxID=83767 RepID=A0A1G8MAQ7_9RHOO|nr:PAS domain S-box-containing protein/diguanylate cyclase (GGDEF) domain-containing protein [Propionivibrio dicarboxylicus]